MKFMISYVEKYKWWILFGMAIKLGASLLELLIPYVLEYLVDTVAPTGNVLHIFGWGILMLLLAVGVRWMNITANRNSVRVARNAGYELRRDLFLRSMELSGRQVDLFGLPSITSRMTSDSYNVQNFLRAFQTLGVRAPILLVGGIAVTLTMDVGLAAILCIMAPIMIFVVVGVSIRGIPLYEKVQSRMDQVVRVMRENITGIRVVKALSKEKYERERFRDINDALTYDDIKAGVVMALPGPLTTLALNVGLVLVVLVGARRVNAGLTSPGVILAFLTYFNMILMGIMGLNRFFMMMSKANASAGRIAAVVLQENEPVPIPENEAAHTDREGHIVFDHVTFRYNETGRPSLQDVDFEIKRGGSLGIIGATGCGKTTIINLLMRFYDVKEGAVFIGGRDVRTFEPDELRRHFGTVFQNDVVFADTLEENIVFGRAVDEAGMKQAATDAMAAEFIEQYSDTYLHEAAIRGANLSGGQKQRVLISRALAADPEILILDDASSALDYRTDAKLRQAIREHHKDATLIVVAQRVSSIMSLDHILMLDEGVVTGYGTHEELMESCPAYREICMTQMGEADDDEEVTE